MPDETHPSALVSWLVAQYFYLERKGEHTAADHCLDMIREFDPDHPLIRGRR